MLAEEASESLRFSRWLKTPLGAREPIETTATQVLQNLPLNPAMTAGFNSLWTSPSDRRFTKACRWGCQGRICQSSNSQVGMSCRMGGVRFQGSGERPSSYPKSKEVRICPGSNARKLWPTSASSGMETNLNS